MADDNIDFRFLGRQVQSLQTDVRDMRAGHLRLESDVVSLRADMSRVEERFDSLEQKVDGMDQKVDGNQEANRRQFFEVMQLIQQLDQKIENHHRSNQAQFEQHARQATTNMQILLAAIGKSNGT